MTIWKSKGKIATSSNRQIAGEKQERDVAFYLRRAFKDSDDYIVINDYSFTYNEENAQIDHLIIHRFGFLIIESKSIYGEVKINSNEEWSRSYKGAWAGIASPIKQAEMQLNLLKSMLAENKAQFLGKILGMQQGVRGRKWDAYCAVSNSCILHRDNMPKDINARIIKSESIEEAVRSIGDRSYLSKIVSTEPKFSNDEMESIANFLMSQANNLECSNLMETASEKISPTPKVSDTDISLPVSTFACKKCGEVHRLNGMYGKYGYYVNCQTCGTNTSMKQPCPSCQSNSVKVTKKRSEYWLICDCSQQSLLFKQQEF